MLTTSGPEPLTPSPGLLCSVAVTMWLDSTPAGEVAFLLIAHPPARRAGDTPELIGQRMRGLADGLGLAPASQPLPDMGRRLFMHGRTAALLVVDGCNYLLRVPTGGEWSSFVTDGGPVAVALGLDELATHANRETVEAYLTKCTRGDRLLMGKTYARRLRYRSWDASRPTPCPRP
jgi:hypothetical protein